MHPDNFVKLAGRLTAVIIGLVALLAVLPSTSVNACMCMPTHPQTHYCDADYVIIARILRKRIDDHTATYKIAIKKAYKMNDRARGYLSDGKLKSSVWDSMCGTSLDVGKLYVVAGNSERVSLCSYARPYAHMSLVERRGFAGGYRKGCACDIRMAQPGRRRTAGGVALPGQCEWNTFDKCETSLGACVPSRGSFNETVRPAKCHWRSSPLFNECLNENEP